jgi:hypothetical protein
MPRSLGPEDPQPQAVGNNWKSAGVCMQYVYFIVWSTMQEHNSTIICLIRNKREADWDVLHKIVQAIK